MRKLGVFNFITMNGFFKGTNNDISWHRHGEEEAAFSIEGVKSESVILFGRVTYDLMADYWPTEEAMKTLPEVAQGMTKAEKIVFSRTMKTAEWKNTRIVNTDVAGEVRRLKQAPGNDLIILGSGSIVTLLAGHDLIDHYQFMIDPVVLGEGSTIFRGLTRKLDLKLMSSRVFKSGVVLLTYEPLRGSTHATET